MIYFDNAATTMPSEDALNKASQFNKELYFNPSALYKKGLICANEIKKAKEKILNYLRTTSHEVIFTSCGSESDNTAVFSSIRGTLVTSSGEHSAIYKSFTAQKLKGRKVEFIPLNDDGTVNTEKLFDFIKNNQDVSFVSIVHVNNETGGINDINYIADEIKKINKNIIFHSDGVQSYGKIPYSLSKNIDLYSLSAHKINGLKGTGALIKKKGLNINPLIHGGGQENGFRSGTENVFGIKVFEYASDIRYENLIENYDKISEIKQFIVDNLNKNVFKIINSQGSPYILSVSAVGLRGEVIMHSLENEDIIVGNGSACSSKNRFSRVMEACGYGKDVLDGIVRISFSPDNTMEEAKIFVSKINQIAEKLKRIM